MSKMQGSTSYRRSFGPESVEELKKNINSTHDEFLLEDDPVKKADSLRYMSMYAMQFLHLVAHDKKFLFKETERVLHHSAMNISDFDPREGSVAFEYLSRYAHNILDQPWRSDFHTIKLTSGFYVHNISSQLQNAHEILVAMGYVHVDEITLKVVPNLDAKKLKAVSRDMIVASQECLILSQIWQRVADQEPDYPLTIGEVFEFRRGYLGDTDTICKTMLMDIRRRNHEAKLLQNSKNSHNFVPVDKLIEYEGMDSHPPPDNPDSGSGVIVKPEKELDIVENVLRNTRLMHVQQKEEEEHIYDPVYSGPPIVNGHGHSSHISNHDYARNSHHSYPIENNPSSAFVANKRKQSSSQLPSTSYYHPDVNYSASASTRYRDSMSPMIPKTVSNCFNQNNPYGSSGGNHSQNNQNPYGSNSGGHSISNSSSMSSISLKQPLPRHSLPSLPSSAVNQPLKFSKVPPEEEIWPQKPQQNQQWSDYYGHPHGDTNKQIHYDKTIENSTAGGGGGGGSSNGRSRKPIMPGDVYPDEYFPPRVVKPTPIHSTGGGNPLPHYQGKTHKVPIRYLDESEDDVMNEALEYQSEINALDSSSKSNGIGIGIQNGGHRSQAASSVLSTGKSVSVSGGWETDSRSLSSEISRFSGDRDLEKRAPSDTDGSSWDGENTILRQGESQKGQADEYQVQSGNNTSGRARAQQQQQHSRPSQIDVGSYTNNHQLYSGSSPDSLNESSHQPRETSKGRTKYVESPKSPPLRSPNPEVGELRNLDSVYYDYLLKKGQRDNSEEYCDYESAAQLAQSVRQSQSQSEKQIQNQSGKPSSSKSQTKARYSESTVNDPSFSRGNTQERRIPIQIEKSQRPNQTNLHSPGSGSSSGGSGGGIAYAAISDLKIRNDSSNSNYNETEKKSLKEKRVEISESELQIVPVKIDPWACRFCTFRNTKAERICEVCAKSKDFFEEEPEEIPAVSSNILNETIVKLSSILSNVAVPKLYSQAAAQGPAQAQTEEQKSEEVACPQCTLLNNVRARICDACGFRLIPVDSPKFNLT